MSVSSEGGDATDGASLGVLAAAGGSESGGAAIAQALLDTFHDDLGAEGTSAWFARHGPQRGPPGSSASHAAAMEAFAFDVGAALFRCGAYHRACAALSFYATLEGRRVRGIHLLGYSLCMTGRPSEAVPHLKRAVRGERRTAG